MRHLTPATEPFDIELAPGIVFTVRPLNTLDFSIAQAAAQRILDCLEDSADICLEAGLLPDRTIDLSRPEVRDGLYRRFLIDELGIRQIVTFKNGDETMEKPSPEIIKAALSIFTFGEIFFRKITDPQRAIADAKKEYGTAPRGTIETAAVPNIATDAKNATSPAAGASPDSTASAVPTSNTASKH